MADFASFPSGQEVLGVQTKKLSKMEQLRIQTATGLLIGKMVDDNINEIIEDQNRMIMEINVGLKIAGKVEIF